MKTVKNNQADRRRMKRGQLAVYVMIGLAIVAVVLVFLLYPRLRSGSNLNVQDPSAFMKGCLAGTLAEKKTAVLEQGGFLNPEGFIVYQDDKIKYLCYTSESYKPCTVQQALIKEHVESELSDALGPAVRTCTEQLIAGYEAQGYTVGGSYQSSSVSLVPGKLVVSINAPLQLTLQDTVRTLPTLRFEQESEAYDLLLIASSIVDFEATLGGSETTTYIQYYPDLKIDKRRLGDGSTIYILTNVISKEYFQFAVRSLVFPPDYGFAR